MRRLTDQEVLGCIASAFMKGEAQKGAKRDRTEDQPPNQKRLREGRL
jgi:hypothetical protein